MPRRCPAAKAHAAAEETRGRKRSGSASVKQPPGRVEPRPSSQERLAALMRARLYTTNAYDDKVCRRLNIVDAALGPGENGSEAAGGLERPAYYGKAPPGLGTDPHTHDTAAYLSSRTQDMRVDPVTAMGHFAKLPAEVRDNIFRNLLVHHRDIRVFGNWSIVFPRSRPNLEANLLRVCKVFHDEGVRILYGRNTFLYLVRDPFDHHSDTYRVDQSGVYDQNRIPIAKYGHLVRDIRIVVEANRLQHFESRKNLPKALQKFLPGAKESLRLPAQLRSVTIEVPAMTKQDLRLEGEGDNPDEVPAADLFRRGSSVHSALKNLNTQFIVVVAHDKYGVHYKSIIDRRSYFSQLHAPSGGDEWAKDSVMLRVRKEAATQSRARLGYMWHLIETLAKNPTSITFADQPAFRMFIPEPEAPEPLQMLPTKYRTRKPKAQEPPVQIVRAGSDEDEPPQPKPTTKQHVAKRLPKRLPKTRLSKATQPRAKQTPKPHVMEMNEARLRKAKEMPIRQQTGGSRQGGLTTEFLESQDNPN